ncbi:MAG: translation initiation factor IF-3 [Candidatus Nealsonbacteria bacterium RIFCSPLOWO2_12_FULL_39_31]|uniref:Translation initiation factor IF-3 n=1 Tax=Candidatus Nealsonbacteria bacterium RIFCSPLOWO2_12_FULL_39_31 TaxID=1801676 RepID=A0A1G2EJY7_9BACT|nr:MAG: translation initiation factor IF-3 [Candidatus Nealsonbacteria bacterium RIFCSPHIGHO2_02_FULL_38_75]OGZ22571.1 MAG: translation initiation factor IF-3 [Candidatus Nealsonbacteria bacterium RIFCSPHIGHO2_12_FULL_38_18]OGZ23672.1 MAG: translation initiation factor IF-3 [Candidatus Nealsonbacteria bacterium RIFCSPLOWO2_01_FULL_38_120]OGZ25181.1 MAG: translation initiation factor IF-3 [Candidatus Nealsonbacteria bacterium RIFCSPLOWO2_02_FULL_38_63]OGZ26083.1 MAG: translation initiation facto
MKNLHKRTYINNQIRAKEVRVIDETGKQLGILPIFQAIQIAQKRNLDLIQVTEKVEPPVCKIIERGKYIYQQQKKEKDALRHKGGELKGIRLTFGISEHDMDVRASQSEKFLKAGDSVRIEMRLFGREKAHQDFAREKIKKFIGLMEKRLPIRTDRELKKEPRGFTMIITKK